MFKLITLYDICLDLVVRKGFCNAGVICAIMVVKDIDKTPFTTRNFTFKSIDSCRSLLPQVVFVCEHNLKRD